MGVCAHCGKELPPTGRVFCPGGRCKQRAWRRRRAGLPEDAFPEGYSGGSRGLRAAAETIERDRAFLVAVTTRRR